MAIEMEPTPAKYLERTPKVIANEKKAVTSLRAQLLRDFPGDPELLDIIHKKNPIKSRRSRRERTKPS